jgi:hypothetical protein
MKIRITSDAPGAGKLWAQHPTVPTLAVRTILPSPSSRFNKDPRGAYSYIYLQPVFSVKFSLNSVCFNKGL